MAADIGAMLFVDLLGMTGYPGSPFTGNIYRDLIMFLIVPTIFIIFVLYIATGRIIPDKKMRIMLGVGAYLFIIVSGYYTAFALLSGPYFIFLIFILGLLGFIVGHFRRGGHGGGGGGGPYPVHHEARQNYGGGGHSFPQERAIKDMPSDIRVMLGMDTEMNPAQRKKLEIQLTQLKKRKTALESAGPPQKEAAVRYDEINEQILLIEHRLGRD